MQIAISLSHPVRPLQANEVAEGRRKGRKKKNGGRFLAVKKNDEAGRNLADPFPSILFAR